MRPRRRRGPRPRRRIAALAPLAPAAEQSCPRAAGRGARLRTRAALPSPSVNLRVDAREALPRHAWADPGAARGARGHGPADDPPSLGGLPRTRSRGSSSGSGRSTGRRTTSFSSPRAGTAAMESAVANVCSPGDRVLVVSHGYFGERWAAIARATASTSTTSLRVGRAAEPGRGRRPPGGDRRCQGRLPHAFGHLHGRRRRRAGDRGAHRGLRRAHRRRRDLQSRGRPARDGRLGARHRAHELPQGAHVPCRARLRGRLAGRARGDRDGRAPALLHGLGAGRSRRRRRARRRSRSRSRSCAGSTSRWSSSSRTGSRPPTSGTSGSAAPAARA